MKGVCASCLDFNIDKFVMSKEALKPTWLLEHDYVNEFINNHDLKISSQKKYDINLKVGLGSKFANKKVLYWASDSKDTHSPLVSDAKKAYGNFENSGVTKANDTGNVSFKINCPQIYRAKRVNQTKETSFFRHMHFVIEKNGVWDKQIYTKVVICNYSFKNFIEMKDTGLYVMINALPAEYFAKDHVPNSYNLHFKVISKMSSKELLLWFSEVIKLHYPKLNAMLKNKKLELYEVPIITYCAHKDCNASELALKELLKKGFVNVNEFGGGMKEYRKNIPVDK